jgi:hypothetical protein
MPLQPGDTIMLIVSMNLIRERIDVRRSQVYALFEERILVAQTTPPIANAQLGAKIEATFVPPDQAQPQRVGFATTVLSLLPDYPLDGGEHVQAVAIAPPSCEPKPTNLRMHCRFSASDELGLAVRIKGVSAAELVDISAGGMLVFFPGQPCYPIGQRLGYRLVFRHGDVIRGQADVVDTAPRLASDEPFFQAGALARLNFLRMDVTDARLLDRTLHRFMFLQVGQ